MKPYYLEIEDKRLASLLANYSGRHLLQLSSDNLASLSASPIPHKICIYSQHNCKPYTDKAACATSLESVYTHLPFANDSIHLVIMPHTLEADKNAQSILTEAWRVLAPNGHLILLGINPVSLWGVYRLFSYRKKPAWNGNFYTIQTLCQWVHYLGGEIQHTESFLFRPPLSSKPGLWLFNRLAWLERISPWITPYMGGVYLIIAQKRVKRLSGLGLVWQFPPVLSNKVLLPNARGPHHA